MWVASRLWMTCRMSRADFHDFQELFETLQLVINLHQINTGPNPKIPFDPRSYYDIAPYCPVL